MPRAKVTRATTKQPQPQVWRIKIAMRGGGMGLYLTSATKPSIRFRDGVLVGIDYERPEVGDGKYLDDIGFIDWKEVSFISVFEDKLVKPKEDKIDPETGEVT